MNRLDEAKAALLGYAATHDAQKAASRKPWQAVGLAAGVGFIASRLLVGGARRARRGPRMMGLLILLRIAMRNAPAIMRTLRALKKTREDQGRTVRVEVVPRPGALRGRAGVTETVHPI